MGSAHLMAQQPGTTPKGSVERLAHDELPKSHGTNQPSGQGLAQAEQSHSPTHMEVRHGDPSVRLLVRRGLGVNVTNFMRISWVEDEVEEQMRGHGEDADQVRIPGSTLEVTQGQILSQSPTDGGSICMGVDSRIYRFVPGLPPGRNLKST